MSAAETLTSLRFPMIVSCPFCCHAIDMDPARCVYHGGDRDVSDAVEVNVCLNCTQPWTMGSDGKPRRLSAGESERFRAEATQDPRFMAMLKRLRDRHERAHFG